MLIYICDDSEIDTLRLKHYLDIYAKQLKLDFEVASFLSGSELINAFRQSCQKPELMFLDILMPGLSGMEAARKLRDMHYQGGIIFTTSSTKHAMDSYEVNAIYYLQKPYERRHFENAMSRCGMLLRKAKPSFTFTHRKKVIAVLYEDIIFFETGPSHNVLLHAISGTYSFSGSLTQIAGFFSKTEGFIPVGRSFLINLDHVAKRAGNDLIMSDGSIVQVPLRKREEVLGSVSVWQNKPLLI